MEGEQYFKQDPLPKKDLSPTESEERLLSVMEIQSAIDRKIFLQTHFVDSANPYAAVNFLVSNLCAQGRSLDAARIYYDHSPSPYDAFDDEQETYELVANGLAHDGQFVAAEKLLFHRSTEGLQNQAMIGRREQSPLTEEQKEMIASRDRLTFECALIRSPLREQKGEGTLQQAVDVAEYLCALFPEGDDSLGWSKMDAYVTLVVAKHEAGLSVVEELAEIERLIGTLSVGEMEKFRHYAKLAEMSIDCDEESERRLNLLMDCGYRTLHATDQTAKDFREKIDLMSTLRGVRKSEKMEIFDMALATEVSDPLRDVVAMLAKKGKREEALQIVETELTEDWMRCQAYIAVLEHLPELESIDDVICQRFVELLGVTADGERQQLLGRFLEILVEHGQSVQAKEIGEAQPESDDLRKMWVHVAWKMHARGENISSVVEKISKPLSLEELAKLGRYEEAEVMLEGVTHITYDFAGEELILEMQVAGQDITKPLNRIYRLLEQDERYIGESQYEGESWLGKGDAELLNDVYRRLFVDLLRVKTIF